jgi:hypothetical protein
VPAVESCLIAGVLGGVARSGYAGPGSDDHLWVVDLREHLRAVPDPRHRRGIRHSVLSILGIAAAAVAAGCRSFTAIGEWAADVPQSVLRTMGARFDYRRRMFVAPDEATVRRVLQAVDADALDAAIGAWLQARTNGDAPGDVSQSDEAIAVDGKSLRGTFARTGGAGVHLLAALSHDRGVVLGQRQVPAGTSEIAT